MFSVLYTEKLEKKKIRTKRKTYTLALNLISDSTMGNSAVGVVLLLCKKKKEKENTWSNFIYKNKYR